MTELCERAAGIIRRSDLRKMPAVALVRYAVWLGLTGVCDMTREAAESRVFVLGRRLRESRRTHRGSQVSESKGGPPKPRRGG